MEDRDMDSRKFVACAGLFVALGSSGFGHDAIAQLNPRGRANFGTTSIMPGFRPDPHNVQVVTGGSVSAGTISPSCRGYVTAQPDVILQLGALSPWFRVYVTSTADTTLVVRRPDGALLCANDTFGLNPAVEGVFPAG